MSFRKLVPASLAWLLLTSISAPASAQVGGERVLSRATISERDGCAVVDVALNYPLRIISSFPSETGNQVLLRLRPTDGVVGALSKRETLPAPRSTIAAIRDIEYDGTTPGGPTLAIYFSQSVYFRTGQTPNFLHVLIAISGSTPDPSCAALPQAAQQAPPQLQPIEPVSTGSPEALLEQSRDAVTARDYDTAIRLLSQILAEPENAASKDAQELLAIARERNGQLAHAKAEYEEYIRRYPTGEDADRVRQRLAALLRNGLNAQQPVPGGAPSALAESDKATNSLTNWYLRGSISEYFYHDQMKSTVNDDVNHVVIDNSNTTLQSELVSAIDADLGMETPEFRGRIRVAAAYTNDFQSAKNDDTVVAQLFFEGESANRKFLTRIGRQYRSAGGLYGRFDGALISVEPIAHIRADIIGGFPVDSSRAGFETRRRAIGASLAYVNGPWNADVYAMRQTNGGILDRLPIGMEARYVAGQSSLLGLFEYDMHFAEVNTALVNGTATLGEKTVLNLSLDYRRTPLLRTSNALIGQTAGILSDLLSTYSKEELRGLALDRTAKSTSAFVNVTQTFSDRFSAGVDLTVWNLSGTPASGNVPAGPATGTEYFVSGNFMGTSLFEEGDMGTVRFGYARSPASNRYTLDFNTRIPMMRELRVGPRFFGSYRETSGSNVATRYVARPTVRLNYRPLLNIELEFEGGTEWQKDISRQTTTRSWSFVANVGVRADF